MLQYTNNICYLTKLASASHLVYLHHLQQMEPMEMTGMMPENPNNTKTTLECPRWKKEMLHNSSNDHITNIYVFSGQISKEYQSLSQHRG
jgi:AMMECR1 domain-containing protein